MSTYSRGYDAVRVGIMGLISVAAFIALFLYVTNRGLNMTHSSVFVRMPIASGLTKGDPVLFRGVKVGEVKRIVFMKAGDVLLQAKLTEKVPLTTDAHAELVAIDLFGRQSLVLMDGTRFAPALTVDDTLQGRQAASMTAQMSELGGRAGNLLSDSTVLLLRATLAGSAEATHQIAQLSMSMNRLIGAQHDNVREITGEMAVVARNIATVTAPAELEASRGNLMRATFRLDSMTMMLSSVMGGIQRGEGTAGKFLHDEKLYNRAETLLASLEDLTRDVKANPKRYINIKVF